MDRVLIFVKPSRSGGNTFNEIIERQFLPDTICRVSKNLNALENFQKLSLKKKNKIRYLTGHMPFGLHKYLSLPCDYITVFRNPISRIISSYYYLRNRPGNPFYQLVKNMSLKEWVSSGLTDVNNEQARSLIGEQFYFEEKFNNSLRGRPLPPDALKIAKESLQKYFKVVGLTERFDGTLLVLKKIYGWKKIHYIKINTGEYPSKSEISEEIIKIINENNQLDIELYKYAKDLFEKEIKNYGPTFTKDLAWFKFTNKIFSIFEIPRQILKRLFLKSRKKIIADIPEPIRKAIKIIMIWRKK